MIVFDRPNPYLNLISGPVLQDQFRSFMGDMKLPITYGMSIGELAHYIVHEELKESSYQGLTVIKFADFNRDDIFTIPQIFPSPNIRSQQALNLYPTLALFEPTKLSIGRGTYNPFTLVCAGNEKFGLDLFYPKAIKGLGLKPKYQNQTCYGDDLIDLSKRGFNLELLKKYFRRWYRFEGTSIFNSHRFFELLMGHQKMINLVYNNFHGEKRVLQEVSAEIQEFIELREPYLLY